MVFYMAIVGSTKKRILREVQKNPVHGYVLSRNLGIPLSSVYEHLKELREHGLIESKQEERKKIYHLTKKGEHLLKAVEES